MFFAPGEVVQMCVYEGEIALGDVQRVKDTQNI